MATTASACKSGIAHTPTARRSSEFSPVILTLAETEYANPLCRIANCNNAANQRFIFSRNGATSVKVANANFCLDAGTGPANGVKMKIWQVSSLSFVLLSSYYFLSHASSHHLVSRKMCAE
jgi:hypothetical protein